MRTLLRVSTLTPSTNTLDRTKGVASSSGGFGPCVWGCERVKRVRVHAHERTISGQPTAALLPHHSWLSQKLQALARTSTVWITRKWTDVQPKACYSSFLVYDPNRKDVVRVHRVLFTSQFTENHRTAIRRNLLDSGIPCERMAVQVLCAASRLTRKTLCTLLCVRSTIDEHCFQAHRLI